MATQNTTDEYSRRVDDLIKLVQQTIDDVNRFLRGEMKVPPEKYQQVKNTLVARQREALTAMNNAIAGQQDLLKGMQTTGKPIPQRRASDYGPDAKREKPRLQSVESLLREQAEIQKGKWLLEHKNSGTRTRITSRLEGMNHIQRLGSILGAQYRVVYESGDPATDRMLTEGLVAGDLSNILLPRVSVDEYVPADPETDNIVVAFFIKGEPKATLPLKNFADHSSGVLGTDYGDSETIMNTQIVYIEFDRENLDMDDIRDLMVQVSMLASLEPDDFTMTFPHTNKKFPYDVELMARYFTSRNNHKNRLAQQKAEKERQAQINKDLQRSQARHKEQELRDDPKPEKQSRQEEPSDEEPQGKQPETPLEALGDMPVKEDIASQLAKLALV